MSRTPRARRGAALALAAGLVLAGPARGASQGTLHAGAVELGAAGAATRVEGLTTGGAALRCGSFLDCGRALAGIEGEIAYTHVSGLDRLGVEANVSWQPPMSGGAAYPYVALASGLRQEWLGSFREVRYPLGVTLGWRSMLGARAATRIEYRFRRVLGDPVADYSEQELRFGVSVLFRNPAPRRD